jgi:hypothetical protein
MDELPSVVRREGGAETTGMVPMGPVVMMEPAPNTEVQEKPVWMVEGPMREEELRVVEGLVRNDKELRMEEMVMVETRPEAKLEMEATSCKRPHGHAQSQQENAEGNGSCAVSSRPSHGRSSLPAADRRGQKPWDVYVLL